MIYYTARLTKSVLVNHSFLNNCFLFILIKTTLIFMLTKQIVSKVVFKFFPFLKYLHQNLVLIFQISLDFFFFFN